MHQVNPMVDEREATITRLRDLLREVIEADSHGWLLESETVRKIREELATPESIEQREVSQ